MTDESFHAFAEAVAARLEVGRVAYGDRSFSAEPPALIDELSEELLDVCGWSFLLWCRLRNARAALEQVTR